MKITLELDKDILTKYARHIGLEENELHNIKNDDFFKESVADVLEKIIDICLD